MARGRRQRVEHTEDWEQLRLLVKWPEQERYEEIRPLVLFGDQVLGRAVETGTSERTLYRRMERFERDGVESLFASEEAKRRLLPLWIRNLIVGLKAEYPSFNLNEIANIVYVHSGRKPDVRTVRGVLEGSALPLKVVRLFEPYHEIPAGRERRIAVVSLHSSGWSAKAIAGYLKVNRDTVYEVLRRWVREGPDGLEDRKRGRPRGTGKVDLRAMNEVRRLQQNPGLGAFRVHAALEQVGIHLSERTCGRILAINRRIYGYAKPKAAKGEKRPMPFASSRRHEYWTADVRYVDDHRLPSEGRLYVVAILENHSRAMLASAVTRNQDLSAFLSVLYRAVERYGSPEALVTDSGSIFLANRAKAIYGALGIAKHEIERGMPWQSYVETAFNVQRRMADWHFSRAESWSELVEAHDRFVEEYNGQAHFAHLGREDGRRSPGEVLGWVTGLRYLPEDLERAFFLERHSRVLDDLGYARFRHWRVYGEEGLARREAELWLQHRTLTLEYGGEALARYAVEFLPGDTKKLKAVSRPELFESSNVPPRLRLFGLEALGEGGWLKSLKLDEYAPRDSRRPTMLQAALFPFLSGTGG